MKKITLITTLCGLLGLGAATVQAGPYWDVDSINLVLGGGETYSGSLDIAAGDGDLWDRSGYDSLTEELRSAYVTFDFIDNAQTRGQLFLTLTLNSGPVGGYVSPIFAAGDVKGAALLDLGSTGSWGYSITNTGNVTFTVVGASLHAQTVPDGASTVGLLGLGLVGIAVLKRRSRHR